MLPLPAEVVDTELMTSPCFKPTHTKITKPRIRSVLSSYQRGTRLHGVRHRYKILSLSAHCSQLGATTIYEVRLQCSSSYATRIAKMSNLAMDRTVASCYDSRGSTNIPLPKSFRSNNADKFKIRYEETEKERKQLLSQNEKCK